ncbi:hypothetical protein, partial [Bacteroides sp.]|uniref:hypothetical protein n=1 Tax=Bacteroides sp. TaxID=29523 RepID=UPI00262FC953
NVAILPTVTLEKWLGALRVQKVQAEKRSIGDHYLLGHLISPTDYESMKHVRFGVYKKFPAVPVKILQTTTRGEIIESDFYRCLNPPTECRTPHIESVEFLTIRIDHIKRKIHERQEKTHRSRKK